MKKKLWLLIVVALINGATYAQKPYARFNHVALYVSDINKSTAFYTHFFHLDSIKTPGFNGSVKWFSLGGDLSLHLVQTKKENISFPKDSHIAFSVASLNDFIIILKKENIDYGSNGKSGVVNLRGDGVHQIYFRDPDGYLIEVNDAP